MPDPLPQASPVPADAVVGFDVNGVPGKIGVFVQMGAWPGSWGAAFGKFFSSRRPWPLLPIGAA